MPYQDIKLEINGVLERYEFGKLAKQADGAALLTVNDNVLLATVTVASEPVAEDFLPLTVQYIEKAFANSKIPGGFIKREAKPSEFEVLTSRIIDRSLRPLFPKGFCYEVIINITVLSCDHDADLQLLALKAAMAALYNSSLGIDKFVSAVRILELDNQAVINTSLAKQQQSSLDLFVTGSFDELLMIEMQSIGTGEAENYQLNAYAEQDLLVLLQKASEHIAKHSQVYVDSFSEIKGTKAEFEIKAEFADEMLYDFIKLNFSAEVQKALDQLAKSERSDIMKHILNDILKKDFIIEQIESKDLSPSHIEIILEKLLKELVRKQIITDKVRADGRDHKSVRPIDIETNILPKAHGSALFTRGQTQVLAVATLGAEIDRQGYELLTSKKIQYENFMLHYNFPAFSVGEARRQGPPGRREIGHGNLAKRALKASISPEFAQSIRMVCEVLESNGSSSMASVCSSSLALKTVKVPTTCLIAGVAMGLVKEGDEYAILTDIMGLEDHYGDMDFKVAGSSEGITALQMDIKLGGLDFAILQEALMQAKQAKLHILELMQTAAEAIEPNEDILPVVKSFILEQHKIPDLIGPAGKNIKKLIDDYEVSIDIDKDSGKVQIFAQSQPKLDGAMNEISKLTSSSHSRSKTPMKKVNYQKNQILEGKVEKILSFGAIVRLDDNVTGMIHISKLADRRVESVESVLSLNQMVQVRFLFQDDKGKIALALES